MTRDVRVGTRRSLQRWGPYKGNVMALEQSKASDTKQD
jgi:hypothetical protein